jgi:hypothetical protein
MLDECTEDSSRIDNERRVLGFPRPSDREVSSRVQWDSALRVTVFPNASTNFAVSQSVTEGF